MFESDETGYSSVSFGIEFYMEKEDQEPYKAVYDEIVRSIEEAEGTPPGEYFIFINDHYIDKRRGDGKKKNRLERGNSNLIIKE